MQNDNIFSWAENEYGKMVHVDSVQNGLKCNCFCPCCYEPLEARHGDVREHGFAHCSKDRGANLRICRMVSIYKLAEQIIETKKKICVPSYYGILPEKVVSFTKVELDSNYERVDKQPDIIATTDDGKQFLIDFNFEYKVQHLQNINYDKFTRLSVDLSKQTFETLESFLIESSDDREWVNNNDCFEEIVGEYAKRKIKVRVVEGKECSECILNNSNFCAGERAFIKNNGHRFRVCNVSRFEELKRKYENNLLCKKNYVPSPQNGIFTLKTSSPIVEQNVAVYSSERKCILCEVYCNWAYRNGTLDCDYSKVVGKSYSIPDYAQTCKRFKIKKK